MTISPVSSVNNNIRNLSFGENNEKTVAENKSKLSTETKVLIGAGLTALAAVGIYIATRGRTKVKPNANIKNPAKDVQKTLTEMTAEAFEKAGNKIEKGVAKLSDGTLYSGKITTSTRSGNGIVLEYKNGKLNSAQKFDGDNCIYTKSYEYDEDGVLTKILKSHFDAAENVTFNECMYMHNPLYIREKGLIVKNTSGNQFIQDAKTGKILRNHGKDYFYNPDGSLNCVKDAASVLPDRTVQLPKQ